MHPDLFCLQQLRPTKVVSITTNTMELCDICSRLDLTPGLYEIQHLGPWEEIVAKALSLGSSRSGCGGCAFFVDVLRSSSRWAHRLPELEGKVVNFNALSLDVRIPQKQNGSSFGVHDMNFDVCTAEDVSGMFICKYSHSARLTSAC
jgi:hypothetical protein